VNAPYKPMQQKTPDVLIAGETIDQMLLHLNNQIILAKAQDGSMRPFVDPMPIIQILLGAVQQANRLPQQEN
jgi:hypothetical protein